ncbi:MAG: TonB family protein [Betaproteobacteria bacterium]|nr:TonB family protein [Betaproteobacteria bacterium]
MPSMRQGMVVALIVLLHVGFFYALQAGLMRDASRFVQEELVARLIPPPPPEVKPEPPPPPPPPKKVVAPPPPPPPPRETVKPVETPPPPKAITLPPTPPEPPLPEPEPAPVVVAPPPPKPAPVVKAPPAPPQPAEPKIRSIGDAGIEYVRPPETTYPRISLRMRETGDLVLRLLVAEDGTVQKVLVQKSSGHPRLDNAAKDAAEKAVFRPYIENGHAVPVWVLVPFSFKLNS